MEFLNMLTKSVIYGQNWLNIMSNSDNLIKQEQYIMKELKELLQQEILELFITLILN